MAKRRTPRPPARPKTSRPRRRAPAAAAAPGPGPAPGERVRDPEQFRLDMMRSIVTEPLLSHVQDDPGGLFDIIICLNEFFEGGIEAALRQVEARAREWKVPGWTSTSHYVFGRLSGQHILELADEARALMAKGRTASVVYRIWEDSDVETTLTRTLITVKADAAQRAFQALGDGIVWAVLDSGIDASHPHFTPDTRRPPKVDTLAIDKPLAHLDFTPDGLDAAGEPTPDRATEDRLGHGTHVAGIIAGSWESASGDPEPVVGTEMRNELTDQSDVSLQSLARISGVAPRCRLVSLKVVADRTLPDPAVPAKPDVKQKAGQGKVSWLLRAMDQIQAWNQHGKRLLIHGVNMSLGYDFDARWFGCGQSPLCVEVNRLVKSGVSVVVSAGNSGYPTFVVAGGRTESRYADASIMDPGNAELAVTVGSTHRDSPHLYGVSYFSSRGPTGDGRRKPDLLAPGERIWSCAAGKERQRFGSLTKPDGSPAAVLYLEQTGTSMAAPHVSGAIAAFLSVRREFIGQPERVKEILLQGAIDLQRERYVQGAGLLDLMRMLQIV